MSDTGFASPRTARHYDAQLWLERRAHEVALALAAPAPEDRVLDLATGTGALLRRLAERPAPPRQVIGVDASSAMLAEVPALPPQWQILEGDARHLPLADASLEVVLCAYLIHLLEAPERCAVLAEVSRVLVPGGRLALVSLLEPTGLLGDHLFASAQRALCRRLGRGSGWCALDPADELDAAGLRPVRAVAVTRGYRSLCLLAERT